MQVGHLIVESNLYMIISFKAAFTNWQINSPDHHHIKQS